MHVSATSEETQFKFPWKISSVLYAICFGPQILSANSLFWDDWTLFDFRSEPIIDGRYSTTGSAPWREFIEDVIFQSNPIIFRIVSLCAFYFAGYFFYQVLKHVKLLTQNQLTVATLVFMLIPVNSARIALINNNYAFGYFIFFLAWYLLVIAKRWPLRILALTLFFISYASLPVITFTIIPIIHQLVIHQPQTLKRLMQEVGKLSPLILLPGLYLVIRQIYWPPQGGSAEMYTPHLLGIIRAFLFLGLCSLPLIYGLLVSKWRKQDLRKFLIASGVLSIAIAAFPYMVGGHLVGISEWLVAFVPNHSDWNSRHQLMLPLGIALISAGLVDASKPSTLNWSSQPGVMSMLIACIVLNITFAQEYFLDSRKQDAIITALSENDDIRQATAILVDDSTTRFNARGRLIRSYEWESMLASALRDDGRKITKLDYFDCLEFQPDALVRISSPDGRLLSTLRGKVSINITVEKINPCGN